MKAKFSARSKGHSLFAVALDFYKLTRNKNAQINQLVQLYFPRHDTYIKR